MSMIERQAARRRKPPMQHDDVACVSDAGHPMPAYVRGACPALAAPMPTGDGLLVRLKPLTSGLTLAQFRQLCRTAGRNGNGILEITTRGSLQIRGLAPNTLENLRRDLDQAGIEPETGVAIETPALSGLDPMEIADARQMAARLRAEIAALPSDLALAAKLSIVVDGRSRFGLDDIVADIRLFAAKEVGNWHIGVGGTARSARLVDTLPADKAATAVSGMLLALGGLGPRARGRDLYSDTPFTPMADVLDSHESIIASGLPPFGIHLLTPSDAILGLKLRFGQSHADDLAAFLDLAARSGANEIRTAPDHMFFLLGLTEAAARDVQLAAANFGLSTSPDDPANHIASCAGAGACASAFYQTKAAASDLIANAPRLLDGSIVVHLSGCPKGCAHPTAAALAVVGTATGFGIVVNGAASSSPIAYIRKDGFNSAIRSLDRLLAENKDAGESANACLTRLGMEAIAAAIEQG